MKIPKYIEKKLFSMDKHSNKAERLAGDIYEWLEKQVDATKFDSRNDFTNNNQEIHHFVLGDYDVGVESHQMIRLLVEHIQGNYDYFKKGE